ncbi:hypothetical protein [Streptomyces sp. NPDC093094]|uniref:hypothetical protein n=1 Tax=Streptomyces sp. NPDC093094 TaxID=3366026 RepID=UPI003807665C
MSVQTIAVVLSCALAVLISTLLAGAAGCLARRDGATGPTAAVRAAQTFAGTLTVLAAVTGAVASVLR